MELKLNVKMKKLGWLERDTKASNVLGFVSTPKGHIFLKIHFPAWMSRIDAQELSPRSRVLVSHFLT